MTDIVADITAIVARERSTTSTTSERGRIHDAISALPDINKDDAYERRWQNYEIEVQSQSFVDAEAAILRSIRPLDLAAAPEVAAVIPFDKGSVLVRRYWACEGEHLTPLVTTSGPLDPAARERFRRDMAALAASGRVHTYARGLVHFLVSDRTRTIVLNRWASVETGDEERCQAFLKSIDRQLASRD